MRSQLAEHLLVLAFLQQDLLSRRTPISDPLISIPLAWFGIPLSLQAS